MIQGSPATSRLAAYGFLGLPLAMAALPIYVHVPKFYSETVGLSLATVGALLLAARLLDALQDPLLGWWSDRRSHRAGGRWTFVAAGAAGLALGMLALFNPPRGSGAGWLLLSLAIVYTAFSLATISYQAYGAEISQAPRDRVRVTAWREGFGLAGVVMAALLPQWLGLEGFAWLFAPLVIVAVVIAIAGSPRVFERPRDTGFSVATLLGPLANPRFRWLLAVFLLSGIAAAVPATLVLFFVDDVVRRPDLAGAFLAVYFGAGALGLPAWVWLAGRWGRGLAWIAGMALAIAAFGWAYLLGPGDTGAFFAICALSGVALGADLALPPAMLAEAIDDDAARGGERREGAYFGLWNLATKLNLALAAGMALPALEFLGYRAGAQGVETRALSIVYALLPCLLKAGSAAILFASPWVRERKIA